MKQQKKRTKDSRWVRDSVKEEYWRKQLALWQASGLSIRAFCKEHGVVETSFYAWRRELIVRSRENGSADEITSSAQMTPNLLKDGRGRTIAIRFRQTDQPALSELTEEHRKPNPFVPIRLVQGTEQKEKPQQPPGRDNSGDGKAEIEIVLPGGAVIKLNEGCNVRLVSELLSALKG